jgi:hypothetical protein
MNRVLRIFLMMMTMGLCLGAGIANPVLVLGESVAPLANKRVIFEEDVFWTKPEEADRILARIRAAGFTTLVVNVWHGRGTMWPSQLAPWDASVARNPNPDFDPVGYLIDRAKAMDIEVHAWFTVALRQSDLFPEFAPEGTPEKAFDVHHRDFQVFMAQLVGEVVDRYDVKGINLDYIRTMGFCRSAECQTQYTRIHQRNLLEDIQVFQTLPGGAMKKMVVPSLVNFQETAVRDLVATIAQHIRTLDPQVLISVDALPGQIGLEEGQNSVLWVNEDLIDVVFRMDYYQKVNFDLVDSLRSRLKYPDALTLLISNLSHEERKGTKPYFSRSGQWLAGTIDGIWNRWPNTGIGVYMSKFLSDDQIAALRNGPGSFPDQAIPLPPSNLTVK